MIISYCRGVGDTGKEAVAWQVSSSTKRYANTSGELANSWTVTQPPLEVGQMKWHD